MAQTLPASTSKPTGFASLNYDEVDSHIDALLAEAELRMRQTASALATAKAPSSSSIVASLAKFPKLDVGALSKPYIKTTAQSGPATLSDDARARLIVDVERRNEVGVFRRVEDPVRVKKAIKEKRDKTAGPDWFNLPRTEMTPQIRREIQMIKLRGVLDPHKHFKKDDSKELPKYFQMGTIIEGATEFHSARIARKDRKKSMIDEIMSNKDNTARFTRKYNNIQSQKRSGKKDFYKKMKAKRRGAGKQY